MSNDKLNEVVLTIRRSRPPINEYHTHRIPLPKDSHHTVFSILESAMEEMEIADLEVGVDDSGLHTVQRIDDLEASRHFVWKPRLKGIPLEGEHTKILLKPGDTVLWDYVKA